jgi:hypothetical protein
MLAPVSRYYVLCICTTVNIGRYGVVGIDTRYGLEGSGMAVWVRFSAPGQTGPGAHPVSCTAGAVLFAGVNRPGCGVDHAPLSNAEVKERVEIYCYCTCGPSWPVLG